MAEGPVHVLLVEDDDDDFLLVQELIAELPRGTYHLERVAHYAEALAAFDARRHDVYLIDYRLGSHSGIELIAEAKRRECHAPLIMLTGQDDPEIDRLAMRTGAVDYLTKDRLDAKQLDRSIRYSLQQRRHEEEIRRTNQQLERRVAERTAELEALNAALQQEIHVRRKVEDALREADHRKDEFLAMLAHELRNPLAPLVAGLDLMKETPLTSQDFIEVRSLMARQVTQLVRLVDDLLDVSRISRGKLQVERQRLDFAEVIQAAVELSQPLMLSAHHAFSMHVTTEPLFVVGDRVRLTQVVGNLLINAAKYTPVGGKIELAVEATDREVLCRVRDNGIGISAEMLPRVFDLFCQAMPGTGRSQGGLGIGLTLAKMLVEMHGGSITAASAGPSQGSEFTTRLPRLAQVVRGRADEEQNAGTSAELPSLRVLVVDDNRPAVFLLERLLRKLGQQVTVLDSPRLALQAAQSQHPQVIISDIAMPEINGYELARQVRGYELEPRPVLVALTGYGQQRDRDAAQDAGFDFHLTKPVGLAELKALFEMLPVPSTSPNA
jgi:signal transduction histidine kinase